MSKVITFSRTFPGYHFRKGEPTFFIEKFWASQHVDFDYKAPVKTLLLIADLFADMPKHHTIRAGKRWKIGDKFSPRVWSGRPYNSKQIIIGPDTEIKNIWDIEMTGSPHPIIKIGKDGYPSGEELARADGLEYDDFREWFTKSTEYRKTNKFSGQIICWNESINY